VNNRPYSSCTLFNGQIFLENHYNDEICRNLKQFDNIFRDIDKKNFNCITWDGTPKNHHHYLRPYSTFGMHGLNFITGRRLALYRYALYRIFSIIIDSERVYST
jgi:hypothetical protein